jgi:exodeoxyribonuclease V gamma subunit
LLQQVQARIRDLVPLAEHGGASVDPADRSIVFQIAHSAQREVEILHDQLLALLADPPGGGPLQPRDIVVMVPDVEVFAPAVRSVFGQYPRSDARHIPFDIADLAERGNNPVLAALEWLLRLPEQRCGLSEIRDLLDVPAVAARFGLSAADLPRLALWMAGAGIRWGLQAQQRGALGLAACGEQNSWLFGLRRMLLGYAVGDAVGDEEGAGPAGGADGTDPDAIEPYAEIGGLDAALVGALAALVDALTRWWAIASTPATPTAWAERGRDLLDALLAPTDARERLTIGALRDGLQTWLAACATAGFVDAVPLAVAREAWLGGLAEPGLNRRFRAGGVTFCTLLPMRAIPFEVVCLLGMNDGDYPRRSPRSDFDLMGLPGQARPGDRARRDDDRQLMLEAVLSARRVLSISWAGRSARDNSAQPPSVLVSQLRDYLAAGWGAAVVDQRNTEHPLQPFSRRYFEQATPAADAPLFTHAREWRVAHAAVVPGEAAPALSGTAQADPDPGASPPLTLDMLAGFLKNPVRDFFRRRLLVVFGDDLPADDDDELFGLDGLAGHGLLQELIDDGLAALQAGFGAAQPVDDAARVAPQPPLQTPEQIGQRISQRIAQQVARIQRAGRLPMAEPGRRAAQGLRDTGVQMFQRWAELQALYPLAAPREPLRCGVDGLQLDDWLAGLRLPPDGQGLPVWLDLSASRLCQKPGADPDKLTVQADKLIAAWVRSLAASACGVPARGVIVGPDASVTVDPPAGADAVAALETLVQAWGAGMVEPLPLAARTGLASAAGAADPALVYEGSSFGGGRGERDEPCLARQFPDFESLCADGRFALLSEALYGPLLAWIATQVSVTPHASADITALADSTGQPTAAATAQPT